LRQDIVPSIRRPLGVGSETEGILKPALIMLEAGPPRYPAPEWFGSGSEKEKMSRIALSHKAAKLMKLYDLEGYKRLHDLLRASTTDSLCPAICMTEGCDYTTEMERDQDAGYCEACGGNTVASALVLAGLI
jgi:hypothetical protein